MICRQCRQIDICSLTYVGSPKAVLRKAEGVCGDGAEGSTVRSELCWSSQTLPLSYIVARG